MISRSHHHPAQQLPPQQSDDRIILHLDYDCFYAQVAQSRSATSANALASRCVGVTQKSILATCNYAARRRGVRKLMRISEAQRICPDIVLVNGEDLSPFRDASKQLYRLVRETVGPSVPVERLGLDEVFVDATRLISANVDRLLLISDRKQLFFRLSERDGDGFVFDGRHVAGCVAGQAGFDHEQAANDHHDKSHLYFRLLLGSHLASHLRRRLESDTGYTASAGIATSKVLSKLVGKENKPANQTTLLSVHSMDDAARAFMAPLPLRSVPGIGARTASVLEAYVASCDCDHGGGDNMARPGTAAMTVDMIRTLPGMSASLLESILRQPSASADGSRSAASRNLPTGARVWDLLHGVDGTSIRSACDTPSQISIEDTYAGRRRSLLPPKAIAVVSAELCKLTTSLLRRMHVDLIGMTASKTQIWLAQPRTLRLTIRPQAPSPPVEDTLSSTAEPHFTRISRSQPLPSFVLSLTTPPEQIVKRLVTSSLIPMFQRLVVSIRNLTKTASSTEPAWTVGLLNVCVTNMTAVAGHVGEDISAFMRGPPDRRSDADDGDSGVDDWTESDSGGMEACNQCGHFLPLFAQAAHARFHSLDG